MHVSTCAAGPALLEEGACAEIRAAVLPILALDTVGLVQIETYCDNYTVIGFVAHDAVAFALEDAQQALVEYVVIDDAVDPLPTWPCQ